MTTPSDIIDFWREAGQKKWFGGGAEFDSECDARFHDLHFRAASRSLDAWLESADGTLALLILLDQIPRNIFRGTAHQYATDSLARSIARHAVDAGFDQQIEPALRIFVYLPFEHSEDHADQVRAQALYAAMPDGDQGGWAKKHFDVIAQFGRYPHRNRVLGRESTAAEQAWLDAGGGFG
ncbi:DUF924 family protein [Noviluteimonas gilva]|uniref:DUF924 family protein n=1 Tax=Noviluteimonas gilva TaxID=2682097 RepID=A0A7C9I3B7_9GAMM|nr:DUF924 family protein [Lysobacter gilvus]MUV12969.1 DUF924 family protein [Lysobacter gilvus]